MKEIVELSESIPIYLVPNLLGVKLGCTLFFSV